MRINLKFGKYKHCLWRWHTPNDIKRHPDRFRLLEGKAHKTGSLYYCDSYLEAQFVMALFDGVGLYSDVFADGEPRFVVASKKRYKS